MKMELSFHKIFQWRVRWSKKHYLSSFKFLKYLILVLLKPPNFPLFFLTMHHFYNSNTFWYLSIYKNIHCSACFKTLLSIIETNHHLSILLVIYLVSAFKIYTVRSILAFSICTYMIYRLINISVIAVIITFSFIKKMPNYFPKWF